VGTAESSADEVTCAPSAVPRAPEGRYPFWESLGPGELARFQGVTPVSQAASLATPIWESDEELLGFLEETHRSRRSDDTP